jgi:hypothetical protein
VFFEKVLVLVGRGRLLRKKSLGGCALYSLTEKYVAMAEPDAKVKVFVKSPWADKTVLMR